MTRLPVLRGKGAKVLAMAATAAILALPIAATAAPDNSAGSDSIGTSQAGSHATTPACLPEQAGFASCFAIQLNNPSDWQGQHVSPSGAPGPSSSTPPSGYGPSDLINAYNLTTSTTGGAGETVAIVDAFNDPNVASDLAVYRSTMHLTPLCGTVSGSCAGQFSVKSFGNRSSSGWGEEISLDVDMVSAICPNCNILLVEAASNSYSNLGAAVNYAKTQARTVAVSNSYGGSESSGELNYDSYYTSSTVAITASSGDGGYGVEYPAASPYVTAVGGTTLKRDTTTSQTRPGWSETAWSGAGSGCSSYETRPSDQTTVTNIPKSCGNRAVADVSADADPNTGVAVYDTFREPGWMIFGGTSVASPIISSVYALASNTSVGSVAAAAYSYRPPAGSLNDVTSGSNGSCGNDLCTATGGWDGPTGNGTPNGIGAF